MKNPENQTNQTGEGRRAFLSSGFRFLAMGTMATYAAVQHVKRQRLVNDPNCIRLNTCTDCVELGSGCKLPKAQEFRDQKKA